MTTPYEYRIRVMRRFLFILLWVLLLLSTIFFFVMAPKVEQTFFPVVSKFAIDEENIVKTENGAMISGVMIKDRGECVPVQVTAYTEDHPDEPSKEVRITFEPGDIWDSRPVGSQYWGPWELSKPGPPLGPVLTIRAIHKCHIFWNSQTVLYRGLTADFFSEEDIEGKTPWPITSDQDQSRN